MMKKLLVFMFCCLNMSVPVWACVSAGPYRGSYEAKDGQVYYQSNDRTMTMLVEGVDISTLAYLDKKEPSTYGKIKWFFTDYVTDKNHVYYQGRVLEGANSARAVLRRQSFDQIVLVDGLDQYITGEKWDRADGYLKDGQRVYYYGNLLEDAYGEHFGWLPLHSKHPRYEFDHDYARSDRHIYMYGHKVMGDAQTAVEIGYGYYLDDKHIYFRGEVLEGALPNVFELKGVFIVSNGHVLSCSAIGVGCRFFWDTEAYE